MTVVVNRLAVVAIDTEADILALKKRTVGEDILIGIAGGRYCERRDGKMLGILGRTVADGQTAIDTGREDCGCAHGGESHRDALL